MIPVVDNICHITLTLRKAGGAAAFGPPAHMIPAGYRYPVFILLAHLCEEIDRAGDESVTREELAAYRQCTASSQLPLRAAAALSGGRQATPKKWQGGRGMMTTASAAPAEEAACAAVQAAVQVAVQAAAQVAVQAVAVGSVGSNAIHPEPYIRRHRRGQRR